MVVSGRFPPYYCTRTHRQINTNAQRIRKDLAMSIPRKAYNRFLGSGCDEKRKGGIIHPHVLGGCYITTIVKSAAAVHYFLRPALWA